jgi:glycosyltransferase involved in cell wall biosynthesis
MALGKPVVATRAAGTVDYIRDGENGLLVAPGDAEALANAVNRLLRDPEFADRLAEAGLRDCRTHLDIERHAERKLAAIAELWYGPRGAPGTEVNAS